MQVPYIARTHGRLILDNQNLICISQNMSNTQFVKDVGVQIGYINYDKIGLTDLCTDFAENGL